MTKQPQPDLQTKKYIPPVTYVLRAVFLVALAAPSIALVWVLVPQVHTNALVAIGAVFAPLIPAWYLSRSVQYWYVDSVNYSGVLLFQLISTYIVPGFFDAWVRATMKVTPEFAEQFMYDKTFRDAALKHAIREGVGMDSNGDPLD